MKYLALIAARGGAGDTFDRAVQAEADRIGSSAAGIGVVALRQVANDPFSAAIPGMRPFDATIEVRGDDDSLVMAALAGISERLNAVAHADLSATLVGSDHVVIPCEPTPVRYQYVMRRKIERSHQCARLQFVGSAGNGKQAVELFRRTEPDVVTMDITMPEMDGIECVEQLVAIKPDVLILVVSALAEPRQ